MRNKHRVFVAVVLLIFLTSIPGAAAQVEEREVILVFDISTSMRENDPDLLAPDSLKQLTGSLPSTWDVGLVTYHSDVVDVVAPANNAGAAIGSILDRTAYTGYTNTGAAMEQAMNLFSDEATERVIVLLTDGEISMPTDAETQAVTEQMDFLASQAADAGITVHTVGLGDDFRDHENSIMGISELTGGRLFETTTAEGLSNIAYSLAFDVFGTQKNAVGAAQMTGAAGSYTVNLPVAGLDSAKVLITAESAISDIAVSGGGASVQVETGKRYAIVDIQSPTEQAITIEFSSTGVSSAELIMEWALSLNAEVSYSDDTWTETIETDEAEIITVHTDRTAEVQVRLTNSAGENVLSDSYFSGRTLPLSIGDEEVQATVTDGYILWESPIDATVRNTISVNLQSLGINMPDYTLDTTVTLEAPPAPTEEIIPFDTISPVVLVVTILGLLLIVGVLLYFFYFRPKQAQKPPPTPAFESKFEFTGKLNLYVTRTPEDTDIPPQTFDLFRLGKTREISLKTVLEKCRIPNDFSGTEKIYFIAGKGGSIQVQNDSNATVLIGRDLLVKKRGHILDYGEKLHVTCEDEISEMEVHYKRVLPSEMRAVANASIRYTE